MPSTTNYFTGKLGKVTVNATDINVEGWSVEPTVDEHDVTSTRTSGYGAVIPGIKRLKFTLNLKWDAAANPLDNPPNLRAGGTITTVKLYLNDTTSPFWSIPTAIVTGTPMEVKVADDVKITINCTADGTFTAPTGNFTPTAA
jgi:hypothetical protein